MAVRSPQERLALVNGYLKASTRLVTHYALKALGYSSPGHQQGPLYFDSDNPNVIGQEGNASGQPAAEDMWNM